MDRLTHIETIDVRGSGANTIKVSVQAVSDLNDQATAMLMADSDDTVVFGSDWTVKTPELLNGQYLHTLVDTANLVTLRVQNDRAHQNPLNRFDVDRDGVVRPLDALRIINAISRQGTTPLSTPTQASQISGKYVDVSGDGRLTLWML